MQIILFLTIDSSSCPRSSMLLNVRKQLTTLANVPIRALVSYAYPLTATSLTYLCSMPKSLVTYICLNYPCSAHICFDHPCSAHICFVLMFPPCLISIWSSHAQFTHTHFTMCILAQRKYAWCQIGFRILIEKKCKLL